MIYENITKGTFINRPNRFIAIIDIQGEEHKAHVKNTGRCKELLIPGAEIVLSESSNPDRKTRYDLIAVTKPGLGLVNIDSQAPNKAMHEWLLEGDFEVIRPEFTYGNSRFDFYLEKQGRKILIEAKGCTLEIDGVGYFPDAPTTRGTKHLRELTEAVEQGYECYIAFVIQMPGVSLVLPNGHTDPDFEEAYNRAIKAGVKVLHLQSEITESSFAISSATKPL